MAFVATSLGFLPGGSQSQAFGVSATGTIAVGAATDAGGFQQSVYWDSAGGIHVLPSLGTGGPADQASGCSADGSVIIGQSDPGTGFAHAVVWTGGPGWIVTDLGFLPGGNGSAAFGCSSDASVIVGESITGGDNFPCVWVASVIAALPTTAGRAQGDAFGCSADGSVIVGLTFDISDDGVPVSWSGGPPIWTPAVLATIPGGAPNNLNEARGCSSDGSIAVGQAYDAAGLSNAVYWNPALNQLAGPVGGPGSLTFGCDGTGTFIVGSGASGGAAVWISGTGQLLPAFAGAVSVDLASAISSDASTIVGTGTDADFNQVAVKWGLAAPPPVTLARGGVIPIDPRFMEPVNWTGQTSTILAPYATIPKLLDAADWRDWANYVTSIPAVGSLGPPRAIMFSDWRAWAHQFNQVIRLLAT